MKNYIARAIEKDIPAKLKPNRVLIILGARRVGKPVLIERIISTLDEPCLLLNGEDTHTIDR